MFFVFFLISLFNVVELFDRVDDSYWHFFIIGTISIEIPKTDVNWIKQQQNKWYGIMEGKTPRYICKHFFLPPIFFLWSRTCQNKKNRRVSLYAVLDFDKCFCWYIFRSFFFCLSMCHIENVIAVGDNR
jgi:hypothetical protein